MLLKTQYLGIWQQYANFLNIEDVEIFIRNNMRELFNALPKDRNYFLFLPLSKTNNCSFEIIHKKSTFRCFHKSGSTTRTINISSIETGIKRKE